MFEAKQNVAALKHLQNPSHKNCSTIVNYLVIYSRKYSSQMIGFEASSKELCRVEIYLFANNCVVTVRTKSLICQLNKKNLLLSHYCIQCKYITKYNMTRHCSK